MYSWKLIKFWITDFQKMHSHKSHQSHNFKGAKRNFEFKLFSQGSHPVDFFNIHKHLLNSVVVLVELLVNSHPLRILHVYQPVLLGASYGCFTCVYYLCGGTSRDHDPAIYPLLDWKRPYLGMLTTLGSCALLVVLHTLLWVLHVARVHAARAVFSPQKSPQPATHEDNAIALHWFFCIPMTTFVVFWYLDCLYYLLALSGVFLSK